MESGIERRILNSVDPRGPIKPHNIRAFRILCPLDRKQQYRLYLPRKANTADIFYSHGALYENGHIVLYEYVREHTEK